MKHESDSFHLSAKALIRNPQGKLLLLRLNSLKYKHLKEDCWDVPGGRLHKNEALEAALRREVQEETGIQHITQISFFGMAISHIRISVANGDVGLVNIVYLCDLSTDVNVCLSAEHSDFQWVDPVTAAELLAPSFYDELSKKIAALDQK